MKIFFGCYATSGRVDAGKTVRDALTSLSKHGIIDAASISVEPVIGTRLAWATAPCAYGVLSPEFISSHRGDECAVLRAGNIFVPPSDLEHEPRDRIDRGIPSAKSLAGYWQTHGLSRLADAYGRYTLIVADRRTEKITLITDPLGLRNVFYAHVPDAFLFGNRMEAFTATGLVETKPDLQSVKHYLLTGFTTDERTLIENIRKVPPGRALVFDGQKVRAERYWIPADAFSSAHSRQDLLDQGAETLRAGTTGILSTRERMDFHVTGGWDTRALLASANGRTQHARFLTSGEEENRDIQVASTMTRVLGLPHFVHTLFPEDLALINWYAPRWVAMSEGLSGLGQAHKLLEFCDLYGKDGAPRYVMHGQVGGATTGDYFTQHGSRFMLDLRPQRHLPRIIHQTFWREGFDEIFDGSYIDMLADLGRKCFAENPDTGTSISRKLAGFSLFTLSSGWAAPSFTCWDTFCVLHIPFSQPRLIEALLQLPFKDRRKKRFHEYLCGRFWPELCTIPSEDGRTFTLPGQKAVPLPPKNKNKKPINRNKWLRTAWRPFCERWLFRDDPFYAEALDPARVRRAWEGQMEKRLSIQKFFLSLATLEIWHELFIQGDIRSVDMSMTPPARIHSRS